jgi:hypothetical protein
MSQKFVDTATCSENLHEHLKQQHPAILYLCPEHTSSLAVCTGMKVPSIPSTSLQKEHIWPAEVSPRRNKLSNFIEWRRWSQSVEHTSGDTGPTSTGLRTY